MLSFVHFKSQSVAWHSNLAEANTVVSGLLLYTCPYKNKH